MVSVDQAFVAWHPGEQAVQKIMCLPERVSLGAIVNGLPDQHRTFHATRLHYVPVTTLDDQGRPWPSILCSSDGTPGFVSSPSNTALHIHTRVWPGDPISTTLRPSLLDDDADRRADGPALVSGIGLDPSTRRRNKFAGRVACARLDGPDLTLELSVSQALGLCPKYIQTRDLVPRPDLAVPRVVHERWHLAQGERLPDDVVQFVHQADTAYLATSYVPPPEDANVHPSRVGTNHRGGRPGFVRVRPGDGRTLVLPNYNGNRMMNSLGNIFVTPLAGIVFPSFSTGTVLYLTGNAETTFGEAAKKLMPRVSAFTTIYVTGFSFVENALPVRERPDTVEISPYCPPVCYLSEETPPASAYEDVPLTLVRTRVHNDTLATFTFEAARPVHVRPSQNTVLDLSDLMRRRARALGVLPDATTAPGEGQGGGWAQSDDCVRTWTVSVPPTRARPTTFGLTIRAVPQGLITPVLHRLAHKVDPAWRPRGATSVDVSALGVTARLRGIGGTLPVPEPIAACDADLALAGSVGGGRRLLWIAGGIGLTPFLGLTRHVVSLARQGCGLWDVVLAVSTREPEVILSLVREAYEDKYDDDNDEDDGEGTWERPIAGLAFSIHVFTADDSMLPAWAPPTSDGRPRSLSVTLHKGRIDRTGTFFGGVDARGREAHVCGPLPFVQNTMASLEAAGVDPESVLRERFTY